MMNIKRAIKKMRRYFVPDTAEDRFRIAARRLKRSDITLDCGANVGKFTEVLARSGAIVHAFEPDPVAFAELHRRVGGYPNVHLYNAGVSNFDGFAKLFLHEQRELDPLVASTGSSLLATKTNVDPDNFVEVRVVRLSRLIAEWGAIRLMKMDIEGHEIDVLNVLLDTGALQSVHKSFVELHDRKNPQLELATKQLRERLGASRSDIDLAWH